MKFNKTILTTILCAGLGSLTLFSQPVLAKASMKSTLITLPIFSWGGESKARGEFNLMGKGSLSIEATFLGKTEELRSSEVELNPNDSMIKSGQEIRLMVSRFTNPGMMAGWYWGMGVGYRKIGVDWSKAPHEDADFETMSLDDEGNVHHSLTAKGVTVAGRLGYRYVAGNGFTAGVFLGARHFENKFEDVNTGDQTYSDVYESDKNSLERRFMTKADHGIEFGWAF